MKTYAAIIGSKRADNQQQCNEIALLLQNQGKCTAVEIKMVDFVRVSHFQNAPPSNGKTVENNRSKLLPCTAIERWCLCSARNRDFFSQLQTDLALARALEIDPICNVQSVFFIVISICIRFPNLTLMFDRSWIGCFLSELALSVDEPQMMCTRYNAFYGMLVVYHAHTISPLFE